MYKPGQSGNPLGRPRRVDPRSNEFQQFCAKHREEIERVGEIALERATVKREPWAIKLCMEYFYPKPGTFVAISKEESKEVNLKIDSFVHALPYEDQQTFLRLWMKIRKGIPAFSEGDRMEECIDTTPLANAAPEAENTAIPTDAKSPA